MKNITKKQKIIMISIISLLMIGGLLSVSFGWFNYTKTGASNTITTKDFTFSFTDSSDLLINNDYPTSVSNIGTRYDSTFTITSNNDLSNGIGYKVYAIVGDEVSGRTRMLDDVVKVEFTPAEDGDGFTTVQNRYRSPKSLEFKDGKADISTGFIQNTNGEVTKTYKVSMWIDDSSIFVSSTTKRETLPEGNPSKAVATEGNVEATRYMKNDDTDPSTVTLYPAREEAQGKIIYTTYEFSHSYYSIKIVVEAQDGPYDVVLSGSEKVLKALDEHATGTCQNIKYVEDGITYFSGTNNCINFNYVWYSGKLWRITAIYPDGTMKLVTEDALTAINWGSSVEYDGSWVYQWLNEDFYDTLVNPNDIIISNATWNYSTDGNSTPVKPETIATQKTKEAPIGLLNAYEYYNAYRNASTSTNYLNIGYIWWLITPYSTSNVRSVRSAGYLNYNAPASSSLGVRPSVNLKSGLEFTGDGSKSSPYKIKDDMKSPINNVTLLSSRSVGEYVKFDDDLYRIVDTSDGITKLTRVDYLRDSGTVISKNFASTVYFGKSSNTQTDTYWDYYLNNNWYNSISSTYKDMLVDGTYYLGLYPINTNYKATICKDATLDNITTNNCTKYTASDTDKIFTGKVGLPRVGEMFSAQLGSGVSSSSPIWTITPYSTSDVRYVYNGSNLNRHAPASVSYGVRPSINLKSGIKIIGGAGTENDPYVVGNIPANNVAIYFNANGGKTDDNVVFISNSSSTYGELPSAERSGYIFEGWYTEKDGGTKITSDTAFNSSSTLFNNNVATLYAHWQQRQIENTDINGSITWNDNDNASGARPNDVTVRLLQDGLEIESRTVTVGTNWSYTFGQVPVADELGRIYTYKIRVDSIPGYFSRIDGYNITNNLLPPRPSETP